MIPSILKNFNLFVDGRGYAGLVEELSLPKLAIKMEEHRAGGMDMPIDLDMGMEKLSSELSIYEYDPEIFKLFGLNNGAPVSITLRGGLSDGSGITPVVVNLRGAWQEVDMGSWKAGDKAMLKVTVTARYYKLTIDGQNLIEIDAENMVRRIGGQDQLSELRSSIGI